jgi:hypothetical protein
MHQEEGFNIFLDTKNTRALPLDLAYPERLNQYSTNLPYCNLHVLK